MNKSEIFGDWLVDYDLKDGGRIKRLCFNGFDLLTREPSQFTPPSQDFGKFETRPVYGYDDCFPSVERCGYPGKEWVVPDHGELCWLPWEVEQKTGQLTFSVKSQALPVTFKRELFFGENELRWSFEVNNHGNEWLPFQHVMHPLLNIEDIADVKLPGFKSVVDESEGELKIKSSEDLRDFLFSVGKGHARMLYLVQPDDNKVQWKYKNGVCVEMSFPQEYFSSIGIWWDHWGYPNEEGHRRCECAFEPIAGLTSKLDDAHKAGLATYVEPDSYITWDIRWKIKKNVS